MAPETKALLSAPKQTEVSLLQPPKKKNKKKNPKQDQRSGEKKQTEMLMIGPQTAASSTPKYNKDFTIGFQKSEPIG